jgi:hypothetical protein
VDLGEESNALAFLRLARGAGGKGTLKAEYKCRHSRSLKFLERYIIAPASAVHGSFCSNETLLNPL